MRNVNVIGGVKEHTVRRVRTKKNSVMKLIS